MASWDTDKEVLALKQKEAKRRLMHYQIAEGKLNEAIFAIEEAVKGTDRARTAAKLGIIAELEKSITDASMFGGMKYIKNELENQL